MNQISNFPVLNKLTPDLKSSVKIVCIFGEKGKEVVFVTNDDNVYAMGTNTEGCLGIEVSNRLDQKIQLNLKPSIVPELCGKQVIYFAYGLHHALALTKTNDVYSWGNNKYGQLGYTTNTSYSKPNIIMELRNVKIKSISCGFYHTLTLTEFGDLYAFGCNEFGQIGNGLNDDQSNPVKLDQFSNDPIVAIACGAYHCLALNKSGRVYGWGYNKYGQLSKDKNNFYAKPVLMINYGVKKIICSAYSSLLLSSEGFVFSYGDITIEDSRNKNLKFADIAASILCNAFAALSIDGNYYIWRFNANQPQQLASPEHCTVNSFHDIFAICTGPKITYLPLYVNETLFSTQYSIDFIEECLDSFVTGESIQKLKIEKRNADKEMFKTLIWSVSCKLSECADQKYEIYNSIINFMDSKCDLLFSNDDCIDEDLNEWNSLCDEYEECYNNFTCFSKQYLQTGRYLNEFKEIEMLGCGGFGVVYKAKNNFNDRFYAIKKVELQGEDQYEKSFKELVIWAKLNTDNVVQYNSSWIEPNNSLINIISTELRKSQQTIDDFTTINSQQTTQYMFDKNFVMYIQMELCNTTLKHTLDTIKIELVNISSNQELNKAIYHYIVSELFLEILECVDYLHKLDKPVIHRDLKPSNILITDGSNGRFVKIADFGLATTHSIEEQSHTMRLGTREYVAPEVIYGKMYTTKADIYSLGIIMKEMFNIEVDGSVLHLNLLRTKHATASIIQQNLLSSQPALRPMCNSLIDKKFLWSLSLEELLSYDSFIIFRQYLIAHNDDNCHNFCLSFMRQKLTKQRKIESIDMACGSTSPNVITSNNSNEEKLQKLKQFGIVDASDYLVVLMESIKHEELDRIENELSGEQIEVVVEDNKQAIPHKITLILEKGYKLEGLSKITINNGKGLLNFKELKIEINGELYLPELKLTGNYKMDGKIFQLLPLKGNGMISIHLHKITGNIKIIASIKENYEFTADFVDLNLTFSDVDLYCENLINSNISPFLNSILNFLAKPLVDNLILENREKMNHVNRRIKEAFDKRLKNILDIELIINLIKLSN